MSMEDGLPSNLPRPPRKVPSPSAPPRPDVGIVHLGLGAFFRAHGAIYIQEAMAASGGAWGIVGVSLRSPEIRDGLKPQDCVYTAVEQGPEGNSVQTIDAVRDVLVAREDPEAVLAAMSAPEVRIVSLTVTEKGYCHDPATGRLNPKHPDIVHDLQNALPVSAPGYLVRALDRRWKQGLPPFTVMTCDNLPENGRLLRGVVQELATMIDTKLAEWIDTECRFPSTMIDRIVPKTTEDDIQDLANETGVLDAAPVMHEPFRQWVVEDNFVDAARPDLRAVGVMLVDNVLPFEHMKLRCLNGTHSALAYLGYLSGHETIADTVADTAFDRYVKKLWSAEIIPVLEAPPGADLNAYADQLFARYANPSIRHRTWQIAMDGSQKLPQRILGTIAENLAAGRPVPGLMLAVAGWMRYVGGVDETGAAIDVKDPLAETLRNVSDNAHGVNKARALLGIRDIFSEEIARMMEAGVVSAYGRLLEIGARAAVEELG